MAQKAFTAFLLWQGIPFSVSLPQQCGDALEASSPAALLSWVQKMGPTKWWDMGTPLFPFWAKYEDCLEWAISHQFTCLESFYHLDSDPLPLHHLRSWIFALGVSVLYLASMPVVVVVGDSSLCTIPGVNCAQTSCTLDSSLAVRGQDRVRSVNVTKHGHWHGSWASLLKRGVGIIPARIPKSLVDILGFISFWRCSAQLVRPRSIILAIDFWVRWVIASLWGTSHLLWKPSSNSTGYERYAYEWS